MNHYSSAAPCVVYPISPPLSGTVRIRVNLGSSRASTRVVRPPELRPHRRSIDVVFVSRSRAHYHSITVARTSRPARFPPGARHRSPAVVRRAVPPAPRWLAVGRILAYLSARSARRCSRCTEIRFSAERAAKASAGAVRDSSIKDGVRRSSPFSALPPSSTASARRAFVSRKS